MTDEDLDNPSQPPRWLPPLAMTLGAWLVAFLVVLTLLTVFAGVLKEMPLPLRALLISGVLVSLMVNVVMPALQVVIARRFAPTPPSQGGGRRGEGAGELDQARCAPSLQR